MFPPKSFTFSAAIGSLQLASHLIHATYAAKPLKFTLAWESKNLTAEELHSRFTEGETDYRSLNGIHLSLGTPRQNVYLKPTILENETYVMSPTYCNSWAVCEDMMGGLFAANESSTWNVTGPAGTITQDELSSSLWAASGENYTRGTDVGEFPGASINLTLDGLEIGVVDGGSSLSELLQLGFADYLGLGPGSKFLENEVKKGTISERAFGYFNQTLDIGGIDEDIIEGERVTSPILQDPWGGLRIMVSGVEVNGQSLMGDLKPFEANIGFAYQNSLFPTSIYEKFLNVTNGYDPINDSNRDINSMTFPGWNDTVVPYTNWNITLTLSNGYKLIAPERAVRSPMVGGDDGDLAQWKPTGYSYSYIQPLTEDTEINLASPVAHGVQAVLGLSLLNNTYLYVDHERRVFELVGVKGSSNGTNDGSGGDTGAASRVQGNLYAWGLVLLSSAAMIVTGGVL